MPEEDYIQVELHQIRKSLIQPKTFLIVTLKEKKGPRSLAIWAKRYQVKATISAAECRHSDNNVHCLSWTIWVIAWIFGQFQPSRHSFNLSKGFFNRLKVATGKPIHSAIITELVHEIFIAEIRLVSQLVFNPFRLSAIHAINLCTKYGKPIYVSKKVMDQASLAIDT